jgi:hypothetical protein
LESFNFSLFSFNILYLSFDNTIIFPSLRYCFFLKMPCNAKGISNSQNAAYQAGYVNQGTPPTIRGPSHFRNRLLPVHSLAVHTAHARSSAFFFIEIPLESQHMHAPHPRPINNTRTDLSRTQPGGSVHSTVMCVSVDASAASRGHLSSNDPFVPAPSSSLSCPVTAEPLAPVRPIPSLSSYYY